jgi:tetratricopeptide (TPR) repeat protein
MARGRAAGATRAAALHRRGLGLRAAGNLSEAAAAFRQAARRFVASDGPRSPDAAHAEVEWAEISELRGDVASAATVLLAASRRLAAQASDPAAPPDIQDLFLRVRLAAAQVSRMRGHYGVAQRTCLSTLRWARERPGPGQVRVASALNGLGVLRKAQGRYADALACYRRALHLVRGRRGAASDLAILYHNLGGSEHARGRLRQAETYARRGLALRRRVLGPRDAAVLADEAALAPILDGLGKWAEAERLYLRALRHHRRWYGPRSYEVSVTLANLGVLHRNRGNLRRAEQHLRQALAIEEALLGPRHPEIGLSLNNLSVVLADRNQREEALSIQARALRIFAASVGPRHPYTRSSRRNLEKLRRQRGVEKSLSSGLAARKA